MNSKETEKFYWNIIKETLIKIIIVGECGFPLRCNEFQIFQVEIKTNNRNCYYLYYFRYNLTMIILITFGVIRTCVVTKKKPKQCSNLILQRSLAFGDSITMNKFLHVRLITSWRIFRKDDDEKLEGKNRLTTKWKWFFFRINVVKNVC